MFLTRSNPTPGLAHLAVVTIVWGQSFLSTTSAQGTELKARFFEDRVLPILRDHCHQCHSHSAAKIKAGLVLDSRAGLLAGGDSGPAIVLEHPEESLLLRAVRYEDPDLQMPPEKGNAKRLASEQISILAQWIQAGAPWPGSDKAAVSSQGKISEEDRAWWAFQPVRDVAPPVTKDHGWVRNPIDAFVFRKLQEHQLTPSLEADRRTLIRRVYFDLVGLPPSPQAIADFVADPAPNAYDSLVDRLLESPAYGEKWARHWLDLVRYAESDGYKADDYRPDAWRYRDYVIQSFNADKPYDQFVREQLAGDELTPDDPEAIVATTFLRHWIYEYNNRDAIGQWETILNDLTDVTGDVFLGLGMACARCHDHKYDPILRRDYYRLQAFFAPILPRQDLVVATPAEKTAYAEKLARWQDMAEPVQRQIDEIEDRYRAKAAQDATDKFPEDVQDLLHKPEADRTPYEQQIAELAFRQITYEWDHLDAKIKGKDKEKLEDLRQKLAFFDAFKPNPLPSAFTVTDVGPVAPPTRIPKAKVKTDIAPGFLTLFDENPATIEPVAQAPQSTGRRTALARWLTRPDNPLSTRVIVNRLWQHHFGRGIVASASDFGKLGQSPSHPELLDWLTCRFLEDGWRFKSLHRLMVTSATYRQASTGTPPEMALKTDPDNRWLWHMPNRRLEGDQIRDALFAATGELDVRMGGPAVDGFKPRRSIYTWVRRNRHDPLLQAFDGPDNISSSAKRNVTTTPTQALLMFNSSLLNQRAKALAKRLEEEHPSDREAMITAACRLTLSRDPESRETAELLQFLDDQTARQRQLQELPPAPSWNFESLPGLKTQGLALEPNASAPTLNAIQNRALPEGDFTIEAILSVKSVYEDGSVRTIASHWDGNTTQPGWAFGVTGKKSSYKPQHLVLQLAGHPAKGGRYEAVFSDLKLELNKPYYVAVTVRIGDTESTGVTFYSRDLSQDSQALKSFQVAHSVTDHTRTQVPFAIGSRAGDAGHRFHGLVSQIRLSNRALPADDLLIHSPAIPPSTESTAGFWRLDSEQALNLDQSGHGLELQANVPRPARPHPERAALEELCHVLLNANEFLYVD